MRTKIICLLLFLGYIVVSCSHNRNDFNPFDNKFQFHQSFDIKDYDTIQGGCGYWILINRDHGGYYQFYLDEPKILAKGFRVAIEGPSVDTTKFEKPQDFWNFVKIDNLYENAELRGKLSKLGIADIRPVRRRGDFIEVDTGKSDIDWNDDLAVVYLNDSIYFPSIEPLLAKGKIVYIIDYLNPIQRD